LDDQIKGDEIDEACNTYRKDSFRFSYGNLREETSFEIYEEIAR
jgi:hypothetical protein